PMGPMGMPPNMPPGMPPNMGPMGMPPRPPSQGVPPRPLFPSAVQSQPPNLMGNSSIGMSKPTFPAAASVSSSATITGAPMIKKPESSSGLTSKLMHPDEDISLEEYRASLPRYKKTPGVSMTTQPPTMVTVSQMQPMMLAQAGMMAGANPRMRPPMSQAPMMGGLPTTMANQMSMAPGNRFNMPFNNAMRGTGRMMQGGRY
ncbi:hypothetical protein LOTGIDRAFT_154623, partial [Lottia gigantea]